MKAITQGSIAAGIGMSFPALIRSALAQESNPYIQNSPLDPVEAALRQIKAEPWLKVDDRNVFLKGMAFDRKNNLTVMAAYPGPDPSKGLAGRVDRSILSITPDKKVSTLISQHNVRLTDHAIHKDGRILIACLDGRLLVANADGSDLKPIAARWNGKPSTPSDLTFDSNGYLYVTDFTGRAGDPTGGVYRLTPDFQTCEPFVPNLITPNGIAFSPDEKSMWVACSRAKQLIHIELDDAGKSVKQVEPVYTLNGLGGDGIRVDIYGNVYLAMNFQGRIFVFDKNGKPIAVVQMPGRERGDLLSTSNIEFKPGTDEVYAVAAGDPTGTWIYKLKGLAKGAPRYSHQ
ncbi:MAG: SMP-30/gluconolactonase/LRE family protein [Terracidiphilus sp.]